jgi:hypothetical protein
VAGDDDFRVTGNHELALPDEAPGAAARRRDLLGGLIHEYEEAAA